MRKLLNRLFGIDTVRPCGPGRDVASYDWDTESDIETFKSPDGTSHSRLRQEVFDRIVADAAQAALLGKASSIPDRASHS